jgi:uncharacterized protein involved in exopolysaccharide biosynthesis
MNLDGENGRHKPAVAENRDVRPAYYVLPSGRLPGEGAADVDLSRLAKVLWSRKFLIVLVTVITLIFAAVYALLAPRWYRAEILLAAVEDDTVGQFAGPLSGIADLAGIKSGANKTAESIAVLRSRSIARSFIEDLDLLPVLFEDDWSITTNTWKNDDQEKWPDIRDAVLYFDEEIRFVSEDSKSGLVELAIEWKDPETAALWATLLVDRVNTYMRARALKEAETNVDYLRAQLATSNLITMQQSIGRLLETELQRLMLASGNDEFAFRVVDPAQVPKLPTWPRPLMVLLLGFVLGMFLGVSAALLFTGVDEIESE